MSRGHHTCGVCGADHHDGCTNLACFVGWHNCADTGKDLMGAPEPTLDREPALAPRRDLLEVIADLRADCGRAEGRLAELREHYAAERRDRIAAENELAKVRGELFAVRDRAARLEGKVERLEAEIGK